MSRIRHRIAAVVCAGLVAPLAISTASGGAIDQDLIVSATSGAPGDVIDVSSASCTPIDDPSGEQERFLRVLLISDTGSGEVLTGIGWGYGSTQLIIPDWADPDDPAVIEAECVTSTFDFELGSVETTEAYDPVAFDLLAGAGAPTQSSSLSRSTVMVGQSFIGSGSGCLNGEGYGGLEVWDGDLSGRSLTSLIGFSQAEISGGSFEAQVDLTERSWGISWSQDSTGRPTDIEVDSAHLEIPAGTYTGISYCADYDENTGTSTFLLLPPQPLEITGDAPVTDISMDVTADTADAALNGAECTAGDVTGAIEGIDLVEEQASFDGQIRVAPDRGASPSGPVPGGETTSTVRSVGHAEAVPFTATPDASGTWSHPDTADFEVGVLVGDATCGDPLGDGFFYDLALGVVDVPEPTVTTTTVATTAPAPSGATPVTGTPTYAG